LDGPTGEWRIMKRIIKKVMAVVLSAAMMTVLAVPVMAATPTATVFVSFNCGGQMSGKHVPVGSNVTAPEVPVFAGHTFCGFDKSLKNVTTNTEYNAVYVLTGLGDTVINATKASLPTPAISATKVADPNAPVVAATTTADATAIDPAVLALLLAAQQAAQTPEAQQAAAAVQAAAQTQQATDAAAAAQAAAQAAQTQQAAALQAAALAAAAQAATQAQTVTTTAVATPAVGVPSWVVGLEGVSQAGAIEAYNYLKTVKGLDDGTIQGNWGGLMHHYAGHGVAGW